MRQKHAYPFKLGTVSATSGGEVLIYGWVAEGTDKDRPLQLKADTEWVRGYAERLLAAVEATEKHTAERLARLEAQKGDPQP